MTALRSDTDAAFDRINGIADLHGARVQTSTPHWLCCCHDGTHPQLDRVGRYDGNPFPDSEQADEYHRLMLTNDTTWHPVTRREAHVYGPITEVK